MIQEDIELYERMRGHYQSENEKLFFETMEYRQQYEETCVGDVLIQRNDVIPEGGIPVTFVRFTSDYYEVNFMEYLGLSTALDTEIAPDVTLFEYLRRTDYSVIMYNRNFQ